MHLFLRSSCLLLVVLAGSVCWDSISAGDLAWLPAATKPVANAPQPTPALRPVLQEADGDPVTTLEQWKPARQRLKEAWLAFLGPLPQAPQQLRIETLRVEQLERCSRHHIRYEAEPDRWVEAFVIRPLKDAQKRPALVVFHPTTAETMNVVAGTGGRDEQHIGLRLAERGFVVICPANFLWEEPTYVESVAAARKRHPQSRGMATMLADGLRAVDVLLTLSDVDPQRLGTIGHSLGGKEALYLLAFDDRVHAGVASEGGIGLNSSNWDAAWYLGPEIREPAFKRDHHELLALIAPRPFLVLGGEEGRGCADGDRSWPYLQVGQQVSQLYGGPAQISLLNHHEGHRLSPETAEKAFVWLESILKPSSVD